jgi:DNA-binding transcriptional regulator YiaG
MKTKKLEKYTYEGLGFPIQLKDVLMVKFEGKYHPKIDVRKVSESVIRELPFQNEKLTGSQIKFIRSFLRMSLREFAKEVVKESHTAVNKWEKFGDKSTNMDDNIEMILRLFLIEKFCSKTIAQKNNFFNYFQKIRSLEFVKDIPRVFLKL